MTADPSKTTIQRGRRRVRHYFKVFKKVILLFVLIMTLVVGWRLFPQIYMTHFGVRPPLVVSAEYSKLEHWNNEIRVIGSLAAVKSVTLAPEIGGIVREIPVESGQSVKKGDPILRLNDDVEQAELEKLEAQLKYSEASFARSQKLKKGNVETQANLEQKESKNAEDIANVNQAKATIAKKNIIAPFEGIVGIRLVNLGQYLQPGTPIMTLTDDRQLYVNFAVPERYRYILKPKEKILFKVDAFGEHEFEGILTTIDPQINEQTRNADVQGTFENTDLKLSPGMFADIRVILPKKEAVVTVSQTAIDYGLYGSAVYVLEQEEESAEESPEDKSTKDKSSETKSPAKQKIYRVKRKGVTTGEVQKGRVVILSGLKEDEHVVSAGQLKLEQGAAVVLSKTPAPSVPDHLTNE